MKRNFKILIVMAGLAPLVCFSQDPVIQFTPTARADKAQAPTQFPYLPHDRVYGPTQPQASGSRSPAGDPVTPAVAPAVTTETRTAAAPVSAAPVVQTGDVSLEQLNQFHLEGASIPSDSPHTLKLFGKLPSACLPENNPAIDARISLVNKDSGAGSCSGIRIEDPHGKLRQCVKDNAAKSCLDIGCSSLSDTKFGTIDLSGLNGEQDVKLVWSTGKDMDRFACDLIAGKPIKHESDAHIADARREKLLAANWTKVQHCDADAFRLVRPYITAEQSEEIARRIREHDEQEETRRKINAALTAHGEAAVDAAEDLKQLASDHPAMAGELAAKCVEMATNQVESSEESDKEMVATAGDYEIAKSIIRSCRSMNGQGSKVADTDMKVSEFLRNAYIEASLGKCQRIAEDGLVRSRGRRFLGVQITQTSFGNPALDKCSKGLRDDMRRELNSAKKLRGEERARSLTLAASVLQSIDGYQDPQTGRKVMGLQEMAFNATCDSAAESVASSRGIPGVNPYEDVPQICMNSPQVQRAATGQYQPGQGTEMGGTMATVGGAPVGNGWTPNLVPLYTNTGGAPAPMANGNPNFQMSGWSGMNTAANNGALPPQPIPMGARPMPNGAQPTFMVR
jgi:hypothetical protein